jgi:predicted nucleotide-binding protein (sugar kinase/HSP70/actin superfamily)
MMQPEVTYLDGDIMKQVNTWKCPECDIEAHYKGLCRSCSEYDDSGKVLKPISRIRLNSDGSVWTQPDRVAIQPSHVTAEMMRAHRKSQRKLTKKQKAMREAQEKAMQEAMKAEAAKVALEANADGVVEIGESEEE